MGVHGVCPPQTWCFIAHPRHSHPHQCRRRVATHEPHRAIEHTTMVFPTTKPLIGRSYPTARALNPSAQIRHIQRSIWPILSPFLHTPGLYSAYRSLFHPHSCHLSVHAAHRQHIAPRPGDSANQSSSSRSAPGRFRHMSACAWALMAFFLHICSVLSPIHAIPIHINAEAGSQRMNRIGRSSTQLRCSPQPNR